MAKVWENACSWFWSESFWLPENVNWSDFKRDETTYIPQPSDLWIPFPIALGLVLLRLIFER